ncbi:MAG: DUF3877 family protein [bacterium]|nr:DUF3877 family protein [bacterium]
MNYKHLEKNICDNIHEGQVKLGYADEIVRIYYFIPSLNGLLDTNAASIEEMDEILSSFPAFVSERLGNVTVSHQGERYCFMVSREGVAYIYEHYKENEFLKQLISVLQTPNCTIETIKDVFLLKSSEVVVEKTVGQEFDYVIYYKDPAIDEFYYCFSIGEMGAYYHRFIKPDYQSVTN